MISTTKYPRAVLVLAAATVLVGITAVHAVLAQHSATTTARGELDSGDPGTECVAQFYKILLADAPPTRDQELDMFGPNSSLRRALALGLKRSNPDAEDVEPMTRSPQQIQQRQKEDAQVAASGPVVLNYFREHREWFVSKNMSPPNVQITSTFRFLRSLDQLKDPSKAGSGQVLVLFTDDKQAPPNKAFLRTVVFRIVAGKIDPDVIWINGDRGETVGQLLWNEVNPN